MGVTRSNRPSAPLNASEKGFLILQERVADGHMGVEKGSGLICLSPCFM